MIYINDKVIQKPISTESYEIVMACKSVNRLTYVQDVIKELYCNNEYLNYEQLYDVLLKTVLEVCDRNQIENILTYDIKYYYRHKKFNNNVDSLTFEDLCNILITKLTLLQIREEVNNTYVDLYLIDDKGKLFSYSEYDEIYQKKLR